MDSQAKQAAFEELRKVIGTMNAAAEGWVELAPLGAAMNAAGMDFRKYGIAKLSAFLNELADRLDLKEIPMGEGKSPLLCLRLKERESRAVTPVLRASQVAEPVNVKPFTTTEKENVLTVIKKVISEAHPDDGGWVNMMDIGQGLTALGVDFKQYGFAKLRLFLNAFDDALVIRDVLRDDGKSFHAQVRLKTGDGTDPEAVPERHLSEQEKAPLLPVIKKLMSAARADPEGWVDLSDMGQGLNTEGVNYKQYGFAKLRFFLNEFEDTLEIRDMPLADGQSFLAQLRLKTGNGPAPDAVPVRHLTAQEKTEIFAVIKKALDTARPDAAGWVDLSDLGQNLSAAGFDYKRYGFDKLRSFLDEFADLLDRRNEQLPDGKSFVLYLRLKGQTQPLSSSAPVNKQPAAPAVSVSFFKVEGWPKEEGSHKAVKMPSPKLDLYKWALVMPDRLTELANLALDEKWYYGDVPPRIPEHRPILRNYLVYTFKRLCHENKVMIASDPVSHEEYAAFNTGLVDKKYEYIYALFTRSKTAKFYWYLCRFVVAGEDLGKQLVKVFNPLPERADYFQGKIQNMLYDSRTGDLNCDYTHIILERVERLPLEFLKENCPKSFLTLEGISIDEVYAQGSKSSRGKKYFSALSDKISATPKILNRLKNRISDAVDLALKKVEWNYKTAIPTYFPTRNCGSLLLPLSLVDEDHVDLALVVERQPSGAYLGQTILPLSLAYSNSRLVTRPDSDWLRTDLVRARGAEDDLDEEDDEDGE